MKIVKIVSISLLIIINLGLPVSMVERKESGQTSNQSIVLGFPHYLKSERLINTTGQLRLVVIYLPEEHYSRDNLNILFKMYSKLHPNKNERMHIAVYTDEKAIDLDKESGSNYSTMTDSYDAIFIREGLGGDSENCDNEYYSYMPVLRKKGQYVTVILKGIQPFATRKVIRQRNISVNFVQAELLSYQLEGVIPSGDYYTLNIYSTRLGVENYILTIRHERTTPSPKYKIKFANENIVYAFLGWQYAVSLDKGKTWLKWDAEDNLKEWVCCNASLIQDVIINSKGNGVMTLAPFLRDTNGVPSKLRTSDFGVHWNND